MPNTYKQITFAEGYNEPFAMFKKQFENNYVFKNLPPEIREIELKKAYKTAIKGNGNTTTTTRESGKTI